MKKTVILATCVLLALIIPIGISLFAMDKNYVILECDYSDAISGANHQVEYDYWQKGQYIDSTANKTASVVVDCQTIAGTYKHTIRQSPANYASNYYTSEDGTMFAVDADGKLTYFFQSSDVTSALSAVACTQEQCSDIARDFLMQYADISNYQAESTRYDYLNGYEITFTKYMDGYPTADCATVTVLDNGKIQSFSAAMLGRLPNDFSVPFDRELATDSVYRKLDSIYSKAQKNSLSITYGEPSFQYTILEDSTPALYCFVTVTCEKEYGNSLSLSQSDRVAMVICPPSP